MTAATRFQRSVALASLAGQDTPIFVEQFVLQCPPGTEEDALRTAWAGVLDRHPGLSAQYGFVGPRLVYRQLAHWNGQRSLDVVDASTVDEIDRICASHYRSFAIASDEPLWRVALIRTTDANLLCITLHHLVFDDRSWRIIRSDLAAALGNQSVAAARPDNFEDFLVWRAAHVGNEGPERERAVSEWANLTLGLEGPTALPGLAASAAAADGSGENHRFPVVLSEGFPDRLRSLLHDHQVTTNHVALGAWAIVLNRLCRTDVVCFGQTRHGVPPNLENAASIVGPMVDTLPFVVPVDDQMSLHDFLADIASRHRRMYALQALEVSELLSLTFAPGTDEVMSTVVNHVLAEEPSDTAAQDLPIVRQRKSAALQPTLTVITGEQSRFEVVTSAAHAEFGRIAAAALGEVLSQFVEQPRVLGDISTVSARSDDRIELRGPSKHFGASTLAELLENSLRSNAHRLALDGAERLTYAELDHTSLALAHTSGMTNHKDQACVAVVAAPGQHTVTAVVATVRSGHYFVCIDPARPTAEIQTLLGVIGPDLVLALPEDLDRLMGGPWQAFALGTSTASPARPARRASPDELAYLVATSGSTGVPKVVEIEQASAVNAICSLIETYGMSPEDRRLRSVSRPGADVFIAELLVPLCSGATLVEAIGNRPLTPAQFFALLDEESITVAGAASSYLAELVDARLGAGTRPPPRTLRMMTTGTEVVDPLMVARWHEAFGGNVTLLNVYGPAEATLVTTTCRLSDLTTPITGPVPIGLPLPNTTVLLLDRAGHPVPCGAVGEICVAGPGVMRGYRGITASTIVEANHTRATQRYYRTGDLGRIGPNGQLVFIGRSDRQVKIRGHRVELDGVEARLRAVVGGSTVAAVTVERAGRLILAAAVESNGPVDDVDLRHRMETGGSPAEVPAVVLAMNRLPRLANGKLDRRSVARHITESLSSAPAADVDGVASFDVPAMVSLWNDLFLIDNAHTESDFFDLGGDSLLAVRLAVEVEVRFGLIMDLDLLYTVRRLGALVTTLGERTLIDTPEDVIRPINVSGRAARVYFMHGAHGETHPWSAIASYLAEDFDSWGISGRVANGRPVPGTVTQACTRYAEALLEHCTDEALVIVGFSASGVLAYETARLARNAGLPVRGVVLLETTPPVLPRAVRWLATASAVRRRRSTAAAAAWLARRAAQAGLRALGLRPRPDQAPGKALTNVPFIDVVDGHRPGRAGLRVTVVGTRDPAVGFDLRIAWGYITGRPVTGPVLDLEQHIQLLDEDRAPAVAAIIREFALRNTRAGQ